jgi:3-methylfumaryl-CoA hydratase
MFAGARLSFERPIHVGEPIRRETELTAISARDGKTGPLIFATTARRVFGPDGLALVEEWDTVFRGAVAPGQASAARTPERPPDDLPWRREIEVDPVTLFRFSALTFNPHRIHYDRPYAMGEEGYAGLVVHGPFAEQCLIDLARDRNPGREMRHFEMRARAPLFDTAPFEVAGRPASDGCELWAIGPDGTTAMTATARFD